MNPLRLTISLGPVAVYLLAIGWINLSRRPVVISGTRDTLALGIALAGMMLIGPIELFIPLDAASLFGSFVWVLLFSFYLLILTFVLLTERARLVVYNVPLEVLRSTLIDLAPRIDRDARWAGDSLVLPNLHVELRLEPTTLFRNVALVANQDRQSFVGWKSLSMALEHELQRVEVAPNPQGGTLIVVGLLISGWLMFLNAQDPAGVAQTFVEVLRF